MDRPLPDNSTAAPGTSTPARVALTWSTHQLRQKPWGLLLVAPALAVAWAAGSSVFHTPAAGAVAALVLVCTIADYLFPVRFTLTKDCARAQCLLSRHEIRWENVRHAWLGPDGVKLSPLGGESRLEAFRGVYLRFADNKEEVLALVNNLRKEHTNKPDPSGNQHS